MKTKDIALRPLRGSKAGGAKRTADNLFSTDVVEALFGVSEGPIRGLVDGSKSFYIGDTPLSAQDGSNNFDQYELVVRDGNELGSDIRSRMGGFGSSTSVNTELAYNTPVTRSGLYTDIDYIDIRLVINRLLTENGDGSFENTGVVKIEYKRTDQATWSPVKTEGASPVVTELELTDGKAYYSTDDKVPYHMENTPAGTGASTTTVLQGTVPAAYDLHAFYGIHAPSGDDYAIWFDANTTNKTPKSWSGSAWVAISGATFTTGKWTWNGGAAVAYVGTVAPDSPDTGHFWAHTSDQLAYVYNGDVWVQAGSTYSPGVVGANSTGGSVEVNAGEIAIIGKTTSSFVKEFRIPVDSSSTETYDIRVTRVSEGNTTEKFFDVTWESFQEVTAATFNFPGLATTQLTARASDQFSSIPDMTGIYEGRIVRVPSNYDPVARTYSGVWDGTWKMEYTNNPAFVGYDLVMNERYGVSAYYPINLNKWDVYEAGQWCDTPTADGSPRFTFNGVLTDPKNGREMINYIFGTFGGRFFDDGNGSGVIRLDRDTQPVMIFTKENVKDGLFVYSQTPLATRHNDVTVNFTNPDLNWQEDRRHISDDANIAALGRNPTSLTAVGCTSVPEAIRRGRYKLITGLTEKTMVSFSTNRVAEFLQPYDIVLLSDEDNDFGYHGRVETISSATQITCRDGVFIEPAIQYQISFNVINNLTGEFTVATLDVAVSTTGLVKTINTTQALPGDVDVDTVFTVHQKGTTVAPKPFRILDIEPSTDGDEFKLSAIEVNRLKWDYVDGIADDIVYDGFYNLETTTVPLRVGGIDVRSATRTSGNRAIKDLLISWEASPSTFVTKYRVSGSINGSGMKPLGEVASTRFEWADVAPADYIIQVEPIGYNGIIGQAAFIEHRMLQGNSQLPMIKNLTLTNSGTVSTDGSVVPQLSAQWDHVTFKPVTEYKVRFRNAATPIWISATVTSPAFLIDNPLVGATYEFEVTALAEATIVCQPTTVTATVVGDNVAPPMPTGWTGQAGFDTITLSGSASPAPDFKAFRIYGSTAGSTALVLLAEISGTTYTRRPEIPAVYTRYRVSAVDFTGNESSKTAYITVAPLVNVSSNPPATPAGLVLSSSLQEDGSVRLVAVWNANSETDLVGYDLKIREGSGNDILVFTGGTRYEWTVLPAKTFTVSIRAKNTAQLTSNYTTSATHTTISDTTPPAALGGLSATAGFGNIWLRWGASTATDLSHYEIFEQESPTPAPVLATESTFTSASTNFVRSALDENVTRSYWVRAVDTSGNKGAWSYRVTATTPVTEAITSADIQGVIDSTSFASSIKPVEVFSNLPTTGHVVGRVGILTTDNKLYRNTGSGWTAAVPAVDVSGQMTASQIASVNATSVAGQLTSSQVAAIESTKLIGQVVASQIANVNAVSVTGQLTDTQIAAVSAAKMTGQVVASQIANGAINTTKFASGLRPVESLGSLPTTGNVEGRMVLLTTDGKLYRRTGNAWVSTTEAADITGQLQAAQVAAIEASKVTGQMTSAQIASLDAAKLAGTISEARIATLDATKLTGIVNEARIAGLAASKVTGQLTDTQIAAVSAAKMTGQVVASQIANGAINTTKFASGLRPVESLGSLPTTGNVEGRMVLLTTDGKLYRFTGNAWVNTIEAADIAGQLQAAQIAALEASKVTGQMTSAQIASLDAAKLAGTIAEARIATLDATKLTGTVNEARIAGLSASKVTGQMTSAQIASVDAAKLTGTVVDARLSAVSASKLTGTIDEARIASLTASKVTGQIVGTQIGNNAVSSEKIAANAITAREIAANSITATEIAAGAITAAEIAAGSITASRLGLYDTTNLIDNPDFAEGLGRWVVSGTHTVRTDSTLNGRTTSLSLSAMGPSLPNAASYGSVSYNNAIRVRPGEQFFFSCALSRSVSTPNGSIIFDLEVYDKNGNTLSLRLFEVTGAESSWASTNYSNSREIPDIIPGGLTPTHMRVMIYTTAATTTGGYQFSNVVLLRKNGAELIVDGSIVTNHLSSNSITTGKIAASAVTANEIASNAITSAKIAAGAITAGKIAAGSIVATDIAAKTLTAGQIAANAITTSELATNAVTAINISAGAVTAGKIATNAVVADNIAANAITAGKIGAGEIIAGKLATNAVLADNIAANAITAGKIAANAVTAEKIVAGAITAGKIATGAITASEIAAGAITASKLLITDTLSLFVDPRFETEDSTTIELGPNTSIAWADISQTGTGSLQMNRTGGEATSYVALANPYGAKVGAGEVFYAETAVRTSSFTLSAGLTINVLWFDENLNYLSSSYILNDGGVTWQWTTYSGKVTAPENAFVARWQVINTASNTTTNTYYIDRFLMRRADAANLIVDGSIAATQLAAKSITAAQLAVGAITTNEIAANSITSAKIGAGEIIAGKLATNAVLADNIAANAITAGKIGAGEIVAGKLATNAVSANNIAANAITAAKIGAGEIIAGKLATNAVVADNIAANAITSAKIGAGEIIAGKLATNAVLADNIAANAITAGKIAAGAITAAEIAAGAITAGKIAVGAITASEIAAGAITASKLLITDTSSLFIDPRFETADSTTIELGPNTSIMWSDVSQTGTGSLRMDRTGGASTSYVALANPYGAKIGAGETFYVETAVRTSSFTLSAGLTISVLWFDENLNYLSSSHILNDGGVTWQWTKYSGKVTAPENAFVARWQVINTASNTTTNTYFIDRFLMRRADAANLIVDGSIAATQLAAKSITAAQIAVGAVTVNEIAANAITSAKIAAGAITAGKIAAGTITANEIASNTITAGKIGAGEIIAGKLATNAVVADNIAANAITSGKISAGAIIAGKLAVNSVAADNIAANAITSGKITAGAIIAGKIAANAITANEIAANAITSGKIAAGAVSAREIAAGAITAKQIGITDFENYGGGLNLGSVFDLDSVGLSVVPTTNPTHITCVIFTPSTGYMTRPNIQVQPGDELVVSTWVYRMSAVMTDDTKLRIGGPAGEHYLSLNANTASNTVWTELTGTVTVPSNIYELTVSFWNTISSGSMLVSQVNIFRKTAGKLIVDGSIKSNHLTTNEAVITGTAQIANAVITEAKISGTLNANKITAGTALANSLTINGQALGTVQSNANDPAARINAASTSILPGKITLSGSTTLSSWQKGGDLTHIDGGEISANTISANKLEIGSRNITLTGIQFEHNSPSANHVTWTAGTIRYISDTGATTSVNITANTSGSLWSSGVLYVYWVKNATALSTTTSPTTAFGFNNVVLATYEGGTKLDADYGRTIIDGSNIKTGTVTAAQIKADTITATQIAGNTITAAQIAAGTLTADKINTSSFNNSGLSVFGGDLHSSNYVNGSSGWSINNNGSAQFNNLIVRNSLVVGSVSDGSTHSAYPSGASLHGTFGSSRNDLGPWSSDNFWTLAWSFEYRHQGVVATAGPEGTTEYTLYGTRGHCQYRVKENGSWGPWRDLPNNGSETSTSATTYDRFDFSAILMGDYEDVSMRVVFYSTAIGSTSGPAYSQHNVRKLNLVGKAIMR